jgi:hypothetical protein
MRTEPYRDRDLGAALLELAVPEHGKAFFAELQERLVAERDRRHTVRRTRWMSASLAVVGIVLLAALVFLTLGLPRLRSESDVARAAVIRTQVMKALAETRTVHGAIVYRAFDVRRGETVTTRQTFAADAAGDLRLTDVGGIGDLAYNASQGVERAVTTSASIGSGRFFAERTGLAPGPPDHGPSAFLLDRELGAVVRALAAAHNPRVDEISFDGRPAWRLDTAMEPNSIFADTDHLEVIVDKKSGFPVRVLATLRGAFRSELRVQHLVLDGGLPAHVRFPADAEVLRTDEGFRHVAAADVAKVVGYEPLIPSEVPAGFHLTTIGVAMKASATGAAESNPPSLDVVSLAYRRGVEQFIVTTRRRSHGSWHDPFGVEGIRFVGEPVRAGGALAGAHAELVVDPRVVPHLWALTDRLVVTVSGDLSRKQLLAVAQSLSPQARPGTGPAASASLRRCKSARLTLSGRLQGATQSLLGTLALANRSIRACALPVAPSRVSLVVGTQVLPALTVRLGLRKEPPGAPTRRLAGRGRVRVGIQWRNWCGAPSGNLHLSLVLTIFPSVAPRTALGLVRTPPCVDHRLSSRVAVSRFIRSR